MEATTVQNLTFELGGGGIEVTLAIDDQGGAHSLRFTEDGDTREFSGEDITAGTSDEGTRASVLLEAGLTDAPVVRFSVLVPAVIVRDESPVDVTAAGVRSTKRSRFGGDRPGPQQSYEVFALSGTAFDDEADTCRNWSAFHGSRPPAPKTLRVTGACTFGTTGFRVELERAEPQGINPKILLLNKTVIKPPEGAITAPKIAHVEARYEEVTDVEYDSVTILPGGPTIPVQPLG
ncbi:MAG: hypothetical protein LC798_05830 [Chloroflexi bacterium]|nr:hypothetical protein [Chloroflexota bacterium]